MGLPRIYQPILMKQEDEIALDSDASHHLSHVLRKKPGDKVILFNGFGGEYTGTVLKTEKRQTVISIQDFTPVDRESPLKIHLGHVLAKGERMDFVMQKSVELGVKSITPISASYSQVKFSKERVFKKMAHWKKIIIHACEQSGRTQIPDLKEPLSISAWCEIQSQPLKFVLDPVSRKKITDFAEESIHEIAVLIGAEGGLREDELEFAYHKSFIPVSLGPRILRTETAALAALTLFQAKWGDI